jgi:thiol-disulfide isomerase/thioredoxin
MFLGGIMAEYRGPFDAKGMVSYLLDDSRPSVTFLSSVDEMKGALQSELKTIVLGFFSENDISEDEGLETFSVTSWGQYQASADTLRGHASFYASSAEDLLQSFELTSDDLPKIYMLSEDNNNLIQYQGEFLEMKISDWVLKHSSPSMGELTLSSSSGELFTAQFFSSAKLKFILLLSSSDLVMLSDELSEKPTSIDNDFDLDLSSLSAIQTWQILSTYFKNKALFSYMVSDTPNSVADVMDFFNVKVSDLPMIVAHDPTTDAKYKSKRIVASEEDSQSSNQQMKNFVAGVLSGVVSKIIKSEPIPKNPVKNFVLQVVGHNLIDIVSQKDKDVMLELYAPWCAHCKRLRSTYDILGRAVAAESRIVVAKIDGTANDIPSSWNVKGYPTILWFPAKDKPYASGTPVPRPYWDAGYSLHEMIAFMQREGSFDMKTLKVATLEQQGQLLSEEDSLRAKYELEDK